VNRTVSFENELVPLNGRIVVAHLRISVALARHGADGQQQTHSTDMAFQTCVYLRRAHWRPYSRCRLESGVIAMKTWRMENAAH